MYKQLVLFMVDSLYRSSKIVCYFSACVVLNAYVRKSRNLVEGVTKLCFQSIFPWLAT